MAIRNLFVQMKGGVGGYVYAIKQKIRVNNIQNPSWVQKHRGSDQIWSLVSKPTRGAIRERTEIGRQYRKQNHRPGQKSGIYLR